MANEKRLIDANLLVEFIGTRTSAWIYKPDLFWAIEQQPTVNAVEVVQQWTPVTEGLPALHMDDYEEPDGSRVQFEVSDDQWVITAAGYQTKARYEQGVVFQGWVGEYGETVRGVTHWMPLPEPPKEGNA